MERAPDAELENLPSSLAPLRVNCVRFLASVALSTNQSSWT